MNWHMILYALGAIGLIWFGWYFIRNNPDMFTRENLDKSFTTVGLLALGLIGFIALLVFLLKHGG